MIQFVVAEPVQHNFQRFHVPGLVDLDVGFLTPEIGFNDAAAAYTDLHPASAQVVQHTDLFDQPYRVMQGKDVDTWAEPKSSCSLGNGGQKYVLGRSQAVDRGRVMFRQVVREESGRLQPFDLHQAVPVNLVQRHVWDGLDVVEYAELQRHRLAPVRGRKMVSL
jgi:hypothetical protein